MRHTTCSPGAPFSGDKLTVSTTMSTTIPALQNLAHQLRIDSILSTTASASGHPTTCMSSAEIVATLFFDEMRYDPEDPQNPHNDRFVLSKGHAAPIPYAAWAEAGLFPRSELLRLRPSGSDPAGHPTPRRPVVDVATGSPGPGICAAGGTALTARRMRSGRSGPAERAVEAATDRFGPRRTSHAAAVVRGRRHRIARAGNLRRDRNGVERAPDRLRLSDLRLDRRR